MSLKFGFTVQAVVDEGRVIEENISVISAWLRTQNLPQLTREQIVVFLLSCDNKEQSTKSTIKAYYKVRATTPEIFVNRDLARTDLQIHLNRAQLAVLPAKTDDGCAIIVSRVIENNYKNITLETFFTNLCIAIEVALYDYPPTGLIIVFDVALISIKILTWLRFGLLNSMCHYFQEGLPIKLNQIFMINCSYVIDKTIQLLKPITKKEVLDKIQCFPSNMDMETFYENCLPKRCLPRDYGGDLLPMAELHELYLKKVISLKSFFDVEEKQWL